MATNQSKGKGGGSLFDEHEVREFEDGEHKTRPLVSVRGADCGRPRVKFTSVDEMWEALHSKQPSNAIPAAAETQSGLSSPAR